MTADLEIKLRSRLNGATPVTPSQIQRFLDKSETFTQVSTQLDPGISPEVVEIFLSKRKGFDGERLKRFKVGLEKLKECYGDKGLSVLTTRCIRKNGTINFGRLRKALRTLKRIKMVE